jgi:hypothetical protein
VNTEVLQWCRSICVSGYKMVSSWHYLTLTRILINCCSVASAATKIVIDYAFTGNPLPASMATWLPSSWQLDDHPRRLLLVIACALVVVAFVSVVCGLSSRWQATKASRILAVIIRKRVFNYTALARTYD